jgi:hypothetical protein
MVTYITSLWVQLKVEAAKRKNRSISKMVLTQNKAHCMHLEALVLIQMQIAIVVQSQQVNVIGILAASHYIREGILGELSRSDE